MKAKSEKPCCYKIKNFKKRKDSAAKDKRIYHYTAAPLRNPDPQRLGGYLNMDEIFSGIKKLKSSGDFDKIDLSQLDCFMDELKIVKKEELLSKHPYKMWQGKNGKWCTYISDEKGGRKLRYRNSKIEIENLVIRYVRNKIESPTVREVFDEWIRKRLDREEIEKSTYSRYQRNFEENFSKIKDRKIRTISEIEI